MPVRKSGRDSGVDAARRWGAPLGGRLNSCIEEGTAQECARPITAAAHGPSQHCGHFKEQSSCKSFTAGFMETMGAQQAAARTPACDD